MSPQVIHSLKQAGIMIVLAVLGVVATEYTGILEQLGLPAVYVGVVGGIIPPIVRWFEGMRDGQRNAKGEMVRADVGFAEMKEVAMNTPDYELPALMDHGNKIQL